MSAVMAARASASVGARAGRGCERTRFAATARDVGRGVAARCGAAPAAPGARDRRMTRASGLRPMTRHSPRPRYLRPILGRGRGGGRDVELVLVQVQIEVQIEARPRVPGRPRDGLAGYG